MTRPPAGRTGRPRSQANLESDAIELGTDGNLGSLQKMARSSKNAAVHFFEVKNADHFNLLAPTNRLIAERILRDTVPKCTLEFTEVELNKPFTK